MSFQTLTHAGLGSLVQVSAVKSLAGGLHPSLVDIFERHFCLNSRDVGEAFQESFRQTLVAIIAGLVQEEFADVSGLRAFLHRSYTRLVETLGKERIAVEFSDGLKQGYLLHFAQSRGLDDLQEFCREAAEDCKKIALEWAEILPLEDFPDVDIAGLLNDRHSLDISGFLVERIAERVPVQGLVLELLAYQGLLGCGVLHFFREALRRDPRVAQTLSALRQEGIWADLGELRQAQQQLESTIHRQLEALQSQLASQREQMAANMEQGEFEALQQGAAESRRLQLRLDAREERLAELPQRLEAAAQAWRSATPQRQHFERHLGQILEGHFSQVHERFDGLDQDLGGIQGSLRRIEQQLHHLQGPSSKAQVLLDKASKHRPKQWSHHLKGAKGPPTAPKAGFGPQATEDLCFFEGVWRNPISGTLYCASLHQGALLIPYSYESDLKRMSHYFDCLLREGQLFMRFCWTHRPITGASWLWVLSQDTLMGGWWYDRDLPEDLPLHGLHEGLAGMHPSVWERVASKQHFPAWAEDFFGEASH